MQVLGQFDVVMTDPPWDIHMELPYGACRVVELLPLPMWAPLSCVFCERR